jgi:hypothetical protein
MRLLLAVIAMTACGGMQTPDAGCHSSPSANQQPCCPEEAGEWNRCVGTQRYSCEPRPNWPSGGQAWYFNGTCSQHD